MQSKQMDLDVGLEIETLDFMYLFKAQNQISVSLLNPNQFGFTAYSSSIGIC